MTLLQFPADRRMVDIRRCVDALLRLQGQAANEFWRSEMVGFAAGLRETGASELEISHQAGLFMQAVQLELQMSFAEDRHRVS